MLVFRVRERDQGRRERLDDPLQFTAQIDTPVLRTSYDLLGRRRALAPGVGGRERTTLVEQIGGGDPAKPSVGEAEERDLSWRDSQHAHRRYVFRASRNTP